MTEVEAQLEALQAEVAGMRFPLMLVGGATFCVVLLAIAAMALLGGIVSGVFLVLPLLFLSLPLLLFTGAGFAAIGSGVDPDKLVLSLNLQLAGWILILLQGLGLFGLVLLGAIVALTAFL